MSRRKEDPRRDGPPQRGAARLATACVDRRPRGLAGTTDPDRGGRGGDPRRPGAAAEWPDPDSLERLEDPMGHLASPGVRFPPSVS
jgi:hypothetical protein